MIKAPALRQGCFHVWDSASVHQNVQKTDCPLWTFVIFGDIIKPHVNICIFYVNFKEEQENGKKNEDHGR